jgi:hypothetical protein
MSPEIEAYARELTWILHQITLALEGLIPPQLHWSPSTGTANSAYAIGHHVIGSSRVYALGFGCGRPVTRDRAAEFTGSGASAKEVIVGIRQLEREIGGALAKLTPDTLDERILPAQELWGTGQPKEISRREALVESIRHAALHLGELRLTRDLAVQQFPHFPAGTPPK